MAVLEIISDVEHFAVFSIRWCPEVNIALLFHMPVNIKVLVVFFALVKLLFLSFIFLPCVLAVMSVAAETLE